MYHDISSTVIMLRQFDQWVPAHEIKVPREDLEIQWTPPFVHNFLFFCEQEQLQKHLTLLDKKSCCVYGSLERGIITFSVCVWYRTVHKLSMILVIIAWLQNTLEHYKILYNTIEHYRILLTLAPFDLVDESAESLYGRETDRDLRSACRYVTWFLFVFLRTSSVGGGGGGVRCQTFLLLIFPCSADHERDWPPCCCCCCCRLTHSAYCPCNWRNYGDTTSQP